MQQSVNSIPTLDQLRTCRDDITALAARYDAHDVRVFGSVARGDATPDSAIDLLVSFAPRASLYDMSGLWQGLQTLLGRSVDLVSDHPRLKARLRERIARDAVAL